MYLIKIVCPDEFNLNQMHSLLRQRGHRFITLGSAVVFDAPLGLSVVASFEYLTHGEREYTTLYDEGQFLLQHGV